MQTLHIQCPIKGLYKGEGAVKSPLPIQSLPTRGADQFQFDAAFVIWVLASTRKGTETPELISQKPGNKAVA